MSSYVAARRAGHDDLPALANRRRQGRDVIADERLRLVHRAAVEIGHAAAALRRQAHAHAVSLEHVHRGATGRGLVVFDAARREERDLAPRRRRATGGRLRLGGPRLRTSLEPRREGRARELRQVPLLVDAYDGLHEGSVHAQLVHPVRQGRGEASELADEVRVTEHPVLKADAALTRLGGPGSQHQPRKVDLPPVRRRVRAVVEAELALVAEIDHFLDVARRKLVDVAVDRLDVHAVEEHLERRAERQAPPAPATDVVNPPQLLINRGQIPKLRALDIQRSHERNRGV